MTELSVADAARENLAAFAARAVRLDGQSVVRLRRRDDDTVEAWTGTPFDVLATRAVHGTVTPHDVTVSGNELLAGLSVARGEVVEPGRPQDLLWRGDLPTINDIGRHVEDLPSDVVGDVTDRGLEVARDNIGPQGTPPASLLDQPVLTVSSGSDDIKIQLRFLFALAGMGFGGNRDGTVDDVVRVSATDSWLRMDARFGAVVKRRHALLPLLL